MFPKIKPETCEPGQTTPSKKVKEKKRFLYRWQPHTTIPMDTNHSTVNTHFMKGTTPRTMQPSSDDINREEELEMASLKSVTEEPNYNYSSIHGDEFGDSVTEHPIDRYAFLHL